MYFLVAYDIFDNKRRRKIAKHLYNYSHTYQKSALELEIDKMELKGIVSFLKEHAKQRDKATIFRIKSMIALGKFEEVEFVI